MVEWKPVVGYEGVYSVSAEGQVRREAPGTGTFVGKILKPAMSNHGYPFVSLSYGAVVRGLFVHTLVARAFLGPPLPGHEVNHKDSDRANPHLDNLEYVTRKGNMAHARAKGRTKPPPANPGEAHNTAKLTAEQVTEIRQSPESIVTLARRFGVNKGTISRARIGQNWKCVDAPPRPKRGKNDGRPSKLTPEQIAAISQSTEAASQLAERYGVGKTTIGRIRRRVGYRPPTKLTPNQVLAIREAPGTLSAIGQEYGVSYVHVRNIKARKVWAEL